VVTLLTEAVREFGLEAETSPHGRWVRFRGAHCTVYVLESLWGGDYYMWCDQGVERKTELYRDPLEAIQAGIQRSGAKPRAFERAHVRSQYLPRVREHASGAQFTARRTCDICGAVLRLDVTNTPIPAAGVWFCEECAARTPAAEIDQLVHEVALRGVPLS